MSVFLLGDSTTARVHQFGTVPYFNCTIVDPNITHHYEAVQNYYEDYRGMLCSNYNVSRVGYMFHWGVSTKWDYAGQNENNNFIKTKQNKKKAIIIHFVIYE